MAKLVILITARVEEGHRIGEAWYEAGAPGITFIESYGIRRLREAAQSAEVLPGVLSLMSIMRENERTSLIILSVVEDDALAERLLAAAETILGNLRAPHNGVAFVVDVDRVLGVVDPRHRPTE